MDIVRDAENGKLTTGILVECDGQIGIINVEIVARLYNGRYIDDHISSYLVLHRSPDGENKVFFNTTNITQKQEQWDKEANLSILSQNKEDFQSIIDKYEEYVATGNVFERDRLILDRMYKEVINKFSERMAFHVMDTIHKPIDQNNKE